MFIFPDRDKEAATGDEEEEEKVMDAPEVQAALKSTAELIQNSYERNVTKEYPKGQLIHDGRSMV